KRLTGTRDGPLGTRAGGGPACGACGDRPGTGVRSSRRDRRPDRSSRGSANGARAPEPPTGTGVGGGSVWHVVRRRGGWRRGDRRVRLGFGALALPNRVVPGP